MELSSAIAVLVVLCLCLSLAESDVGVALQQRRRQQQQRLAAYPAAGFKPARQFQLPTQRLEQAIPQPAATYGTPVAATYGAPVPAPAPARLIVAKPARLTAAAAKPARLVANSEAQEDIDDAAEEVQLPKTAAAPAATPTATATPVQPTFAYFPAGAVSFVQPYGQLIAAPQTAAYVNAAYAQPQFYAAYG